MKFANDVAWSEQEMELNADETGRKFKEFFLAWFTATEDSFEDEDLGWGDDGDMVMIRVRDALAELEEEHGHLGLEWLGQMLLLAREHWAYGKDLMQGLTVIEYRVLQIAEALKVAELAESAKL